MGLALDVGLDGRAAEGGESEWTIREGQGGRKAGTRTAIRTVPIIPNEVELSALQGSVHVESDTGYETRSRTRAMAHSLAPRATTTGEQRRAACS